MTPTRANKDGRDAAGQLWLETFQRLASRAAHEIRNPLNGVTINLEVVRQRAARPGLDARTLVPFAEAAAGELAKTTAMVDALLALARPVSRPIDLVSALDPLVVLYGAIAAQDGGAVALDGPSDGGWETSAGASTVRLALAVALDVAVAGGAGVRCRLARRAGSIVVEVHGEAREIALPAPVREAIADEAVACAPRPHGLEISFPALARAGQTH